jgi:hypothetical protein
MCVLTDPQASDAGIAMFFTFYKEISVFLFCMYFAQSMYMNKNLE